MAAPNPFADPFADPSVQQAASATVRPTDGTEDFNPFANNSTRATTHQPAPMSGGLGTRPADDELFRKQEELERKAQELRRREEELEQRQRQGNIGGGGGAPRGGASDGQRHNWPPIPAFIPIEPCFYQDIEVEIPVQFQKTVTLVYYVFLVYILALVVNCIATIFYVIFAGGSIGQLFLAFIQLGLFSPCSFLFWFRPVYKAFRNDSSFNFMVFFFVLFFHSLFTIVQTLGLSNYACGWINALETIGATDVGGYVYLFQLQKRDLGHGNIPVGILMLISALCFTAALGGMAFALITVHRLYRGSGFSMDKARQEFTNGVMSDRNVQQAASAATQAAAGAAFQQATQGRF